MLQPLSLYFILRATHHMFIPWMLKVFQAVLPNMLETLTATSLPLACVSNTLNKTSYQNVIISAFENIKWDLARLVYLFDVQLERNVGT